MVGEERAEAGCWRRRKGDGEARLKKRTGIPGLRAVTDVSAWPFGSGYFCTCSTLRAACLSSKNLYVLGGGWVVGLIA